MTLLSTTAAAFLTSLAARLIVESMLTDRVAIVGSFVGLELVQNAGIAFGIDLPSPLIASLVPIAFVLIAHLAWRARRNCIQSVGFGLILGGALANIADRLGDGFVTDFIDVGFWPVFNVADSFITVGTGILLFFGWLANRSRRS